MVYSTEDFAATLETNGVLVKNCQPQGSFKFLTLRVCNLHFFLVIYVVSLSFMSSLASSISLSIPRSLSALCDWPCQKGFLMTALGFSTNLQARAILLEEFGTFIVV